MNKTTISLVIITCDRPLLLQKLLTSVNKQLNYLSEIIVIDNGVTAFDFPKNLDQRYYYVRTKPCIGASTARNIGWKMSTSQWVHFMDDDDLPDKGYFKAMKSSALDPDYSVIISHYICRQKPTNFRQFDDNIFMKSNLKNIKSRILTKSIGIGGSNVMIRKRSLLALSGWDERLRTSEDRDLIYRILESQISIKIQNQKSINVGYSDNPGLSTSWSIVQGKISFLKKHFRKMNLIIITINLIIIFRFIIWNLHKALLSLW